MAQSDPKEVELSRYVERVWDESIIPNLIEYIKLPNKSPHFDPQWAEHGHMQRAVDLISGWCGQRPIAGLKLEVVTLPGRTPVIFMNIPSTAGFEEAGTVLLYGHLDKQPEMEGWRDGLGPWTPVLDGDRLYGRGGADDGYAAFASLCAIEAMQKCGMPHGRCVVLIEACEESGSYDLPYYVDHLAQRIGSPELVVCLDSGAGNYEQLWLTTSLRGNLTATLRVDVLREGVHSGDASGVVPSSFRIIRELLDRIEDSGTGEISLSAFNVEIPEQRKAQAAAAAEILGEQVLTKFPWVEPGQSAGLDLTEAVLRRTWKPTLCVTGADGMPPVASAGNVLRPYTAIKLSLRLPPTCDPGAAKQQLRDVLLSDPPQSSRVRLMNLDAAGGWNAPALSPWLEQSVDEASRAFFGKPAAHMGEGGTIPFMGMLGEKFPKAQFVITGVLGPESNAHGPNEFLHIPMGKKLTASVARVLADHARQATR